MTDEYHSGSTHPEFDVWWQRFGKALSTSPRMNAYYVAFAAWAASQYRASADSTVVGSAVIRERDRETELRREAEAHVKSMQEYFDVMPYPDEYADMEQRALRAEAALQALEEPPSINAVDPVLTNSVSGLRATLVVSETSMLGRPVPPPPPEETAHEENDLSRVGPLTAGVGGQDLAQSGDRASPPLPEGRK